MKTSSFCAISGKDWQRFLSQLFSFVNIVRYKKPDELKVDNNVAEKIIQTYLFPKEKHHETKLL